tara:strand:+ start:49304 stop:49489 length:186 start_codon:yes stop_codon:yes gene_type:complete
MPFWRYQKLMIDQAWSAFYRWKPDDGDRNSIRASTSVRVIGARFNWYGHAMRTWTRTVSPC